MALTLYMIYTLQVKLDFTKHLKFNAEPHTSAEYLTTIAEEMWCERFLRSLPTSSRLLEVPTFVIFVPSFGSAPYALTTVDQNYFVWKVFKIPFN